MRYQRPLGRLGEWLTTLPFNFMEVKMFKKFIIAFAISICTIAGIKAKGATYTDPCIKAGFDTRYMDLYYFSTDAQNNTTQFSYQAQNDIQSRNYIKPVIVRKLNYGQSYYYTFICKASSNCLKRVTSSNVIEYTQSSLTTNIAGPYYELYNTPVFDDYASASNYSCGLAFDTTHLLGGLVFNYEFDDSVTYSNIITNFDYSFAYSGGSPINSFSIYFEFKEENPVPDDCNRIFVLDYYFLEKTKLEQLYYAYGQDGLSWEALYSVYKTIRDGGASGILQFPNNNLEGKLTFGLYGLLNNGDFAPWIVYNDLGNDKYSFIWNETLPNPVTPIINPYGLLEVLKNYYGDYKKAFFALNYVTFNYIDSYVAKDTGSTKHVYDYYNTFYLDKRKTDGYVFEKRSFRTKNNIDDNNINQNSPENPIGDDDMPTVDLTNEQRTNSYNESIQNSYNNITNNYYYDNGLTENILDYYRGFSDGATDENIDSALGYVKGTLGSLTHIPLLLSYCFNAFFPLEIIRLFQALLIIFVVFMIIRIIKHLFTH